MRYIKFERGLITITRTKRLYNFAFITVLHSVFQVPISHILPETMESFLDEFCLNSEGNVTNNNFKITARFDFLAPTILENAGFSPTNEDNSKENNRTSIMYV